jgi:hypothetical protein
MSRLEKQLRLSTEAQRQSRPRWLPVQVGQSVRHRWSKALADSQRTPAALRPGNVLVLQMDSSKSRTYGEEDGTSYRSSGQAQARLGARLGRGVPDHHRGQEGSQASCSASRVPAASVKSRMRAREPPSPAPHRHRSPGSQRRTSCFRARRSAPARYQVGRKVAPC